MRRAVLLLLLALVACHSADAPPLGNPSPGNPSPGSKDPGAIGTVTKHTDGDTLRVDGVAIRFIGIDTPETHHPTKGLQCYGLLAAEHTAQLLPIGTTVRLEYDVERLDRYGRTLAYVYRLSDGLFVNAALLRDGYAQILTIPPDVAHADEFLALQREARSAGRGLWSACPGPG